MKTAVISETAGRIGRLPQEPEYHCSHSIAVMADRWADDLRPSDIEPRLVCNVCGHRGADVRPDFNCNEQPVGAMGYS